MKFRFRVDTNAINGIVKRLEQLERPLTEQDAAAAGRAVLTEMKSLISKGISPVRGRDIATRFAAYKNPDRYPGKRKSKTPVNLYLSGKQLKDLSMNVLKTRFGYGFSIGYNSPKEQLKEQGHREGANGQPIRPTIPSAANGESFAVSIQNVYLKALGSAIKKIVRR